MSDLKLKGTSVKFRFSTPYGPLLELRKTTDAELTIKREILTEEFLGEAEPDYGSVSMGVAGKLTLIHDDPNFPKFFTSIVDRTNGDADPLGMFTMVGRLAFPSGKIVRVIAADLEFGDLSIKLGSRKAYASTPLDFNCKRLTWK